MTVQLSLDSAEMIVDAALASGRANKLAPLAVAVLDAGGHLVLFKREDGAGFLRFGIASAKAWGSLGMGYGSRELARRAENYPAFFSTLSDVAQGRIAASPGGVLILSNGVIVGAVGISGDTGDNDEICAIAGIKAAGFEARAGNADTI